MSAKTAKGWVVVNRQGKLLTFTVRKTRAWAIGAIETLADQDWKDLRKAGFRVTPCTITVTEEPTK